jgi:hypothetical protein
VRTGLGQGRSRLGKENARLRAVVQERAYL